MKIQEIQKKYWFGKIQNQKKKIAKFRKKSEKLRK